MDKDLDNLRRAFEDGLDLALYEVLLICDQREMEIPAWAASPLQTLIANYFDPPRRDGRRAENPVWRYRQDLIHLQRYETVNEIREKLKQEWLDYLKAARDPKRSAAEKKRLRHYARQDPNESWDSTYSQASKYLKGSPAAGDQQAMKRSHALVQDAIENLGVGGRFYVLSTETRKRFGIYWV